MGWADCGVDKRGRPIGYAHRATCDYEGCHVVIDRGIAHACGGMHGEVETGERDGGPATGGWYCDGYFCEAHLYAHGCPTGGGDVDEQETDHG